MMTPKFDLRVKGIPQQAPRPFLEYWGFMLTKLELQVDNSLNSS